MLTGKEKNFLARELLEVAKDLVAANRSRTAKEFATKKELDSYLKSHPKADKSKHTVKSQGKSKDKPKSDAKSDTKSDKSKSDGKSVEFGSHKKVTPAVKSLSKVKNILKAHKLDEESDEVHEMMGFKKTLGQRIPESQYGQFYVRNEKKLKSDFIKNMNPSNYDSPEAFKAAKERLQKMPVGDFGKILAAISDEE